MAIKAEKPSLGNTNKEMASSSFSGIGSIGVSPPHSLCLTRWWLRSPHCKMRIPIYCPDVQGYVEKLKSHLPGEPPPGQAWGLLTV
jgi:hypothetical protein